jgi:hypothetical protein
MRDLGQGFSSVRRSYGLVLVLLATNLALALLVAIPVGIGLERDLRNTEASTGMVESFDHAWWEAWSERQTGPARDLGPEILGAGFAARNLDLLLRGYLPAGLFSGLAARGLPRPEGSRSLVPDPVILALTAAALALQTFLAGGVLSVLRAPQGTWTLAGLLHGSGFYFGRLLRIGVLSLLAAGLVFAAWAPLSKGAEAMAREAVSERGALAWSFSRFAVLLIGLLFVHAVASYAKIVMVVEERRSAALSLLTALGFAVRRLPQVAVQYAAILALGGLLLAAWLVLDSVFEPRGFRTQLLFLLLAQAFLATRIALRVALLGGQMALYRRMR